MVIIDCARYKKGEDMKTIEKNDNISLVVTGRGDKDIFGLFD